MGDPTPIRDTIAELRERLERERKQPEGDPRPSQPERPAR